MIRTLFSIGALQAGGIVVTAMRAKLFALLLGPAGFGIVATIDQLLVSMAQLSNLSVPFTALKFLSRSHSRSEAELRQSYRAFLRLMVTIALVATLIGVVLVQLLPDRMGAELAPDRTAVMVALLGLPALLLMMFFVNALAAMDKSTQSVKLSLMFNATLLVFGGIGCWLGGIRGIYLAALPGTAILIGATWLVLRARLKLRPGEHAGALREQLATHPQILQMAFFTYIAVASIGTTMLGARYAALHWLGAEGAGLFQACLAIALAIGGILGPASSLYLSPYVNRAIPLAEKIAAVDRFLPRLILLFSLGALPVVLFPQWVLWALFSDAFRSVASLLVWYVIWQYVGQVATVYHHLLIGLDDMRGFCAAVVLGNAVTMLACIVGTQRLGLLGLGLGLLLGAAVALSAAVVRLKSRHRSTVPLATLPVFVFAPSALALIAMLPLAPEAATGGIVQRLVVGTMFLAGLGLLLPRELKVEVRSGLKRRFGRPRK